MAKNSYSSSRAKTTLYPKWYNPQVCHKTSLLEVKLLFTAFSAELHKLGELALKCTFELHREVALVPRNRFPVA